MSKYPFENRDGRKAVDNQVLLLRAKDSADYLGEFGKNELPADYASTVWKAGEREQLMNLWQQIYGGSSALASARSPVHDNWLYIIAAKDLLTDLTTK